MTGLVDEVDGSKSVLRDDSLLCCEVSHCHDDVGRDEVSRAAVTAGVAGGTEPEVRVV